MRSLPLLALTVLLLLAGCASGPTLTAENVNAEGNRAFQRKDYTLALAKYNEALSLSKNYGDTQYEAIALYGIARSAAQLCRIDQALAAFAHSTHLRASLKDSNVASESQNLLEHARVLLALHRPAEAAPLLERAKPLLEAAGVESKDPIGFAEFLDDYVSALEATGSSSIAEKSQAEAIRARNPGARAKFRPLPYPSSCAK